MFFFSHRKFRVLFIFCLCVVHLFICWLRELITKKGLNKGSFIRLNCGIRNRNKNGLGSVYLTIQRQNFSKSFSFLHKVQQTVWKWSERRNVEVAKRLKKNSPKTIKWSELLVSNPILNAGQEIEIDSDEGGKTNKRFCISVLPRIKFGYIRRQIH